MYCIFKKNMTPSIHKRLTSMDKYGFKSAVYTSTLKIDLSLVGCSYIPMCCKLKLHVRMSCRILKGAMLYQFHVKVSASIPSNNGCFQHY